MNISNIQFFENSDLIDRNTISYTREKPLLILDLDEVVIHAVTSQQEKINSYRQPDWVSFEKANLTNEFKDTYYHFFIRNGFYEFYNKIKKHYQIGIWSTSASDYVYNVVKNVFPDLNELSFIWSREKAIEVIINRYSPSSNYQYRYVKDLIKLRRRGVSLKQTVIADDTPLKLERQYGNLIPIKPYLAKNDDDIFEHLNHYLISLLEKENFREIEKRYWYKNV